MPEILTPQQLEIIELRAQLAAEDTIQCCVHCPHSFCDGNCDYNCRKAAARDPNCRKQCDVGCKQIHREFQLGVNGDYDPAVQPVRGGK